MTIQQLLDIMPHAWKLQIFCEGKCYEIPTNELEGDILDMPIDTIDSPEFAAEPHPLCVNLDLDDFNDITNWENFQVKYAHYLYF